MATPGTTPAAPTTTEPAAKRSWGNAYTWMLILSLVFLAFGCLMLLLELREYGFQTKPTF